MLIPHLYDLTFVHSPVLMSVHVDIAAGSNWLHCDYLGPT